LLACALSSAAADYTTYVGDAYTYQVVTAIAVDANGNTYVTGNRGLPASDGSVLFDIFVSKLDQSGNLTILATLGGKASDQANGIALDPAGNIYIAGATSSPDFPLRHPVQGVPSSSGVDGQTGFLVKLSANGTVLYSTYLGGTTDSSTMNAVAADSQGNAYVTGETFASDYPRTPDLPADGASSEAEAVSAAFFAKISSAGDKILYAGGLTAPTHACGGGSICFLSAVATSGVAIAVDPAGNAYIAGNTSGTGLPATAGALRTDGIGAFVAKVNAAGTGLDYLTLLGAANYVPGGSSPNSNPGNSVYAIAADPAGNAYIAGSTSDPNFPVTPSAFQPRFSLANSQIDSTTPSDAFVAKLNPTGTAMIWATFLGGAGQDQAHTIAADSAGNVWVSGTTQSTDFPASSGFPGGNEFLVEFNPSGSSLSYAARFPVNTVGVALAIDAGGVIHAAGATGLVSTYTPGQSSAGRLLGIDNSAGGALEGRVAPGELFSIYGLHVGPSSPSSAKFRAAGFLPTALAGVQVAINGTPVPLLYVSDTQINAVAPLELVSTAPASLRVSINAVPLPDFRLVVDPAIPQVFRCPDGSAAAINQDGAVNSETNPAKVGSFVSIWATGIGFTPGVDGQMTTAAQQLCACTIHDIAQNQDIIPSYAGAAPEMVTGIVQINFRVNATGNYYLTVNGKNSDPFSIFITP
jgi:uncharacterized protein (TIGR03437 family)